MNEDFFTDKAEIEKSVMRQMAEFVKKHGVNISIDASLSYISPIASPDLKSGADMDKFKIEIS